MYALLSKCKNLQLPIDIQLELFDKTVVPILLYGCEIWGTTKCDIIEAVHLKFCKLVLKVKSSTPNCMIYGELGRLPLHLQIKQRVISYWSNLLISNDNKLSSIMYKILYDSYVTDVYHDKWLDFVRNELYSNGLGYVWEQQAEQSVVRTISFYYSERMSDQFKQSWKTDLENSGKCALYRDIKDFKFENYLRRLPCSLVRYITRFRLSSTKLAIETGRYINIEREDRFCNICNLETIGDEYHLIFECKNERIVDLRRKFLPESYMSNGSRNKLIVLLRNVEYPKIGIALGKFLKETKLM